MFLLAVPLLLADQAVHVGQGHREVLQIKKLRNSKTCAVQLSEVPACPGGPGGHGGHSVGEGITNSWPDFPSNPGWP